MALTAGGTSRNVVSALGPVGLTRTALLASPKADFPDLDYSLRQLCANAAIAASRVAAYASELGFDPRASPCRRGAAARRDDAGVARVSGDAAPLVAAWRLSLPSLNASSRRSTKCAFIFSSRSRGQPPARRRQAPLLNGRRGLAWQEFGDELDEAQAMAGGGEM
jgi:hypothetical protein